MILVLVKAKGDCKYIIYVKIYVHNRENPWEITFIYIKLIEMWMQFFTRLSFRRGNINRSVNKK